jgi:hypothetical protein
MATREAVQLGVVLLFPLSLVIVLLAGVARQHGRTRRQTALAIGGITACLAGVVATGLVLKAWRGGPLFDLDRDSFSHGSLKAPDILGLVICATLLVTALRISKWLAGDGADHGPSSSGPFPAGGVGQAEDAEDPERTVEADHAPS